MVLNPLCSVFQYVMCIPRKKLSLP